MRRRSPGHRDPFDTRAVERELLGRDRGIDPLPPPFIPQPISAESVAGFAWQYLKRHYDRFVATELSPGSYSFSPLHFDMWRLVCDPHPLIAFAAPRYHAKSTAVTLAYGLANIMLRAEDYVVVVSDTFEGQAVEQLGEFRRELEENEDMLRDFGVLKLVVNNEGNIIIKFRDGTLARIKSLGMEGPIRGLRWRSKRPGMFLIDDAENTELVESKTRRDKSLKWIMKDLIQAGRHGVKTRMYGTILHHDCSLARFCRDSAWKSKIYRAHKSFNDFSEILWPEMWPEDKLRAKRQTFINQNDADGYSQEYLNDPIAPTDQYFKDEDILGMTDEEVAKDGDYYIGWDFAVTKEQKNDKCVATVWKVDSAGMKYLVACQMGRWDSAESIDRIFKIEQAYSPIAHFTEKGTIDHALGPFLETEMLKRQIYPNLIKITRNKDKPTFATPLQGMIRKHHLRFNKKMLYWDELFEELHRFPKTTKDDFVDALSIVGQGLRSIVSAPTDEDREEEEWLAKFGRRDSGQQGGRNATTGY